MKKQYDLDSPQRIATEKKQQQQRAVEKKRMEMNKMKVAARKKEQDEKKQEEKEQNMQNKIKRNKTSMTRARAASVRQIEKLKKKNEDVIAKAEEMGMSTKHLVLGDEKVRVLSFTF